MIPRLQIILPTGQTWEVALDKPAQTLGRGDKSDIRVDDLSLSRLHARLAVGDWGKVTIRDTGSQNGIYLGDQSIYEETLMVAGQRYLLGDVAIVLLEAALSPDDFIPATLLATDPEQLSPELLETVERPPIPPVVAPHEDQTVYYDDGKTEYILEIVAGPQSGISREVGAAPLVIGRALECDFVMEDVTVSRKHATIMRAGQEGFAVVLQKEISGKLYVNGESCTMRLLRDKDRIRLGRTQMIYHLKDPPPPVTPPPPVVSDPPPEAIPLPPPMPPPPPVLKNRLLLAEAALVVVLLAGWLWWDPFYWFHSATEARLVQLVELERQGQHVKALSGYRALLKDNGQLDGAGRKKILEKKGIAAFNVGFALLDGLEPLSALPILQESLNALFEANSGEFPIVEGKIAKKSLELSQQWLDKGEQPGARELLEWLRETIGPIAKSVDYQDLWQQLHQVR